MTQSRIAFNIMSQSISRMSQSGIAQSRMTLNMSHGIMSLSKVTITKNDIEQSNNNQNDTP